MDSVGEGEGGKIWENGIETCEMSCMKRDASPDSMHDAGCLGLVHWDDPEGWYGEGGGRRVQDGEHLRNKGIKKKKKGWLKKNKKHKIKKKERNTYCIWESIPFAVSITTTHILQVTKYSVSHNSMTRQGLAFRKENWLRVYTTTELDPIEYLPVCVCV